MAVASVPGMNFGVLPIAQPQIDAIEAAANEAARVPLFEALAGGGNYTQPGSCIVTQLLDVDPSWETQQDAQTVCADEGTLRKSTKTNQVVPNGVMTLLYDKQDPMIQVIKTARDSLTARLAYELVFQNTTDKIFAIVQVLRASVTPTDTTGRVTQTVEFLYDSLPVHN